MINAILGKKLGMTSVYDENGMVVPVTVVEAGPVTIMQIKTAKSDGYAAVQIGFGEKKLQRAGKPEVGHAKKAGAAPLKTLREVRVEEADLEGLEPGQVLTITDLGFAPGDFVDVSGTSIGKGYAGVMKRHNFHGAKGSHGVHEFKRHGGAIGTSATPSRVLKGKKMAGQLGNKKVTVQNLSVAEVRPEQNLLFIRGAVPGHKEGALYIRFAKKKPKNNKDDKAA